MIRGAVKLLVTLTGLVAIAYVVFLVPLGERTLFEHVRRIAGTEEAQDLGRDLGAAGERVGDEVRGRLE